MEPVVNSQQRKYRQNYKAMIIKPLCSGKASLKKNLGTVSMKGGGGWYIHCSKMLQFQLGNFKSPGVGLNFSEMSELKVALRHHPKKGTRLTLKGRGGPNSPPGFKNLISLEPKVRLTSNQAVNLSFSLV